MGRFNHIFDPRTGASAQLHRSVTVIMPTATAADALSTAFSLMPVDAAERVLAKAHGTCRFRTHVLDSRTACPCRRGHWCRR